MSNTASLSIVVFDLDDTLYPERDFVLSGYKIVSDYLMKHHGLAGFEADARKLLDSGESQKVFNSFLENHDVEPSDVLINELISVYRGHIPKIELPGSSREVLSSLRTSKRRLSIITDGYLEVQKNKVKALGLDGLVDQIVYSDRYGRAHWKPALTTYIEVANYYKVEPGECIYIGDNPLKDFYGARYLGWKTVRLRRRGGLHEHLEPGEGYEADFEISELEECIDYC